MAGVTFINVEITTEYIKLEGLLKLTGAVTTGGQGKEAIQSGEAKVNGKVCWQRGKKLRPGDQVEFKGKMYMVMESKKIDF